MEINSSCAAIDNDFITHLAEAKLSDDDLVKSLCEIFKELSLAVIIHPLVYDKEVLKDKRRINLLFDNEIIKKVSFYDIFLDDPARKAYYFFLVTEFFGYLNGYKLPVSNENILSYWVKERSLGEIHSLAMCLITACGLFLSDDEDSQDLRKYINRNFIQKVRVYDRKQLIDVYLEKADKPIGRAQRKSLSHVR